AMTLTVAIAPVRKSLVVRADPAHAFAVFTDGIDRWWPREQCDGGSPLKRVLLEPWKGGRWHATCEDGSELAIGPVLHWEPGRRLVLSWEVRMPRGAAASALSEVEVNFIAEGAGATRVELEHRGFERLGDDLGEATHRDVGRGWPVVLDLYAAEIA